MSLPPLNALMYFNAAASQMSFKAAAAACFVTEGAISRQIKRLEQFYGQALFERSGRGVRLTETGRRLHAVTQTTFESISQVSEEILGAPPQLSLSVTSSFAIRWLLPRLADFEALYPDYPIALQSCKVPRELPERRFDASIVYVIGSPHEESLAPPANGDLIMEERLLPVCAPRLLTQGRAVSPEALGQFKVIFNEATGRDWRFWMTRVPEANVQLSAAIRFEHDDTAIQAAVAGHGVALANMAYIDNELAMGSLVPAVNRGPVAIGAHYLVCEPSRRAQPHVVAFREWLLRAAKDNRD